MSRTDQVFKQALSKTNIPLLVLDNQWYKLFTQADATAEIRKLEKKLKELLKEQGKVNEEQKKLKACKKKLMDEILLLADQQNQNPGRNEAVQKEMDHHRRLVEECNERLENLLEETQDIPKEIKEINYQLMLKTMELCYHRMEENQKEIEHCAEQIQKLRAELRENMDTKQDREESTYGLYCYMHHIFGRDVIDIFDMHYNPEDYRPKRKEDGYIE